MTERRVPSTEKVQEMIGAAGGGDMMKAIYDTDNDGIVDNSETLEGSTKAQVQDHTPKAHTLGSHSTKAHSELTDVTADQHHAQAHTLASHSTKAHSELTDVTADQHHAKYTDEEAVTAAKTVKLDEFATPDDNTTLDASTSRHGLLKKLDNIATNFLNGQGGWSVPLGGNGGATVASGQYTGDGTDNRAIAHGLGVIPTLVMIKGTTWEVVIWQIKGLDQQFHSLASVLSDAVTAMTTTNFYVSQTGNCQANRDTNPYYWIAIG